MTGNETRMGPDDLIGREFAIGLRGYDRDEVDAFLQRAAEAWRESMAAAPSINGLSSTAMAALAESEPLTVDRTPPAFGTPATPGDPFAAPASADPFAAPAPADPFAAPAPADPFGGPAPADPFAAPADHFAAPAPPTATPEPFAAEAPYSFGAEPGLGAEPPAYEPPAYEPAAVEPPAPQPAEAPAPAAEVPAASRSEVERDRATAYAERVAAELDRASARTELAQAQEEALRVVDAAQRRAEAVLTGARAKAQAEAESILEDARTRLTPLLEQERAVRARLVRLRQELDAFTAEAPASAAPTLPSAADLVSATEDDPQTPEATFPVGYGSVSVG